VIGSGRDRAVSVTVDYVLVLGITTILITGLLVAVTGVVDDRRAQTAESALDVIGERIAANLMSADRLAQTDPASTVVEEQLPEQISERGYSVRVEGSSPPQQLVLTVDGDENSVVVQFATETPVADSVVRGGNLRIVLTPGPELEVRGA